MHEKELQWITLIIWLHGLLVAAAPELIQVHVPGVCRFFSLSLLFSGFCWALLCYSAYRIWEGSRLNVVTFLLNVERRQSTHTASSISNRRSSLPCMEGISTYISITEHRCRIYFSLMRRDERMTDSCCWSVRQLQVFTTDKATKYYFVVLFVQLICAYLPICTTHKHFNIKETYFTAVWFFCLTEIINWSYINYSVFMEYGNKNEDGTRWL